MHTASNSVTLNPSTPVPLSPLSSVQLHTANSLRRHPEKALQSYSLAPDFCPPATNHRTPENAEKRILAKLEVDRLFRAMINKLGYTYGGHHGVLMTPSLLLSTDRALMSSTAFFKKYGAHSESLSKRQRVLDEVKGISAPYLHISTPVQNAIKRDIHIKFLRSIKAEAGYLAPEEDDVENDPEGPTCLPSTELMSGASGTQAMGTHAMATQANLIPAFQIANISHIATPNMQLMGQVKVTFRASSGPNLNPNLKPNSWDMRRRSRRRRSRVR